MVASGQAIKEALWAVSLSSVTCVLLQFPFFVALLIAVFCEPSGDASSSCGIDTFTWSVVMAILMLKAGVTPVVWMIYTDIRQGFRQGLGVMVCGSKNEDDRRCHNSDLDPDLNQLGIGTREIIASFGWTTLPHPSYSPDLAPSHNHLFDPIKQDLRGKHNENDEEVKNVVKMWQKEQPKQPYEAGIRVFVKRWNVALERGGDYIKK
ncbi:histone-lysine N-methyltransferase SETMAR [Elysia marginata]|uniref:Histone-lysine N-methyltransferase SETMAR n=1 Tax=Elysia marginata TaxID=1093978 RepID=A0AAV4F254_9GAST|nr:histone-lysine N-methyltransferase SETMAR [Elysia marginata]